MKLTDFGASAVPMTSYVDACQAEERMRICLYTESALPLVGGQEIVVDQLARRFIGAGHEVVVLAARHRGRLPIRDELLPYPVVRHPRFISTHRAVGWYRYYVDRLRRSFPFQILHCHSVQPAGYVAACCRNQAGLAVVLTSHGGDLCPEDAFLQKPGALKRSQAALARANAAIAISGFVEERLRSIRPDFGPIERICNGIDVESLSTPVARPTDLSPNILRGGYLLFLGRAVHRKGIDLLVRAYALIPSEAKSRLVIAGDGEQLNKLRSLATELGVASQVDFLGQVEGSKKTWLLQNSIATIMPSRDWEGMPLVLLESFGAGRPVVASDTPGLRELIVHGKTGILVAQESAMELANALRQLVLYPSFADRLGAAAHATAREYDWSVVARRHLDLYERVFSQRTIGRQLSPLAA